MLLYQRSLSSTGEKATCVKSVKSKCKSNILTVFRRRFYVAVFHKIWKIGLIFRFCKGGMTQLENEGIVDFIKSSI